MNFLQLLFCLFNISMLVVAGEIIRDLVVDMQPYGNVMGGAGAFGRLTATIAVLALWASGSLILALPLLVFERTRKVTTLAPAKKRATPKWARP